VDDSRDKRGRWSTEGPLCHLRAGIRPHRAPWRLDNELVGTEEVAGYYIAATRQITLDGESVTSERLAVGSYSAYLSANERELTDGRWGSSAQAREAGSPGRWEASR
jgi:hypothetical protein